MAKYHMTWDHPQKVGSVFIEGDLVDCVVYLTREVYPLKDITSLGITKYDEVKKGTMFDGSVVERPT